MDTLTQPIVLASASPRRKHLLEQIGLSFEIVVSDIDETFDATLSPEETAKQLALQKAQAVVVQRPESLIIGADTIVVDREGILGKPRGAAEAYQMLARLSGQVHRVITGLVVLTPSQTLVRHETTEVKITALSDQDIRWYLSTGEPFDKAGAYAIQGRGTVFVEWIHGCYNNVVGLPLFLLCTMLRALDDGTQGLSPVRC
jgi:septum formation protein